MNMTKRLGRLEEAQKQKRMHIAFGPGEEAKLRSEHPGDIVYVFAEEERERVLSAFDRAKKRTDEEYEADFSDATPEELMVLDAMIERLWDDENQSLPDLSRFSEEEVLAMRKIKMVPKH